MTSFTCVDSISGEVLYKGTAHDVSILASPGHRFIHSLAPDDTYWDGAVWATIPAKPGPHHTWDWNTKTWLDTRTLAEVKQMRIRALKLSRDSELSGGFSWDGSVFDSDTVSQMRLLGLRGNAQTNPAMEEDWRLADNAWRRLTSADALAVWAAFETHMRNCFQTFALLEQQVLQATTIQAVEEVAWP